MTYDENSATSPIERRIDRLERLLEGLAAERSQLVDTITRLEGRLEAAPTRGRGRPPTESGAAMGELVELIRSAPAVRTALTEAIQPDRSHELELARLDVERHRTEQYVSLALVALPTFLAALTGKPELADKMGAQIDAMRAAQREAAESEANAAAMLDGDGE